MVSPLEFTKSTFIDNIQVSSKKNHVSLDFCFYSEKCNTGNMKL